MTACRRQLVAWFGAVALATGLTAQEYRWEPVSSIGVKVRVHKKLKGVPVELGADQSVIDLHKRAAFDPESRQQNIVKAGTPFRWGMDVLAFDKEPVYTDKPTDQAEIRRRAIEKRKFDAGARHFEHFLTEKMPGAASVEFHGRGGKDGVAFPEKRGVPEHRVWEYSRKDTIEDSGLEFRWYTYATAFKLEDREVALVFTWPIFKDKPDAKYLGIAKKMTSSLQVTAAAAETTASGGGDAEKDRFADSPERKDRLAKVVAGIRGIDGWDYFTTPEAIVLYSWKPGSNKGAKAKREAEPIAEHFDAIQTLYRERFPPPDTMKPTYPVLRICFDRHLMSLYGSPPVRAESFYNEASGECVISLGGKQDPESLAGLQGWYHYSNDLFRGAKVSGWYSHGLGHVFGCYRQKGKRWSYTPDKLRINGDDGTKKLFKSGEQASLKAFLRTHPDKFIESEDNEEAGKWRSQAYALADFLMRGEEKLGGRWNEKWSEVLPTYTATLIKTKSATKANAVFDSFDAAEFESAWTKWATSSIARR